MGFETYNETYADKTQENSLYSTRIQYRYIIVLQYYNDIYVILSSS